MISAPATFDSSRPQSYVFTEKFAVKVREVIKLLEDDGWRLDRTRGSHRQFNHPVKKGVVTVAGKPSVDIPPGTLNNILKQAGLKN